MTKRKRQSHDASPETSRGKGDILEEIVKAMHSFPGAKVERNVFLPSVRQSDREREIDVLITGSLGGYRVRIPIECKNVSSPIEVGQIGEFADKLNDVGLPVTLGVFITSSRFRSGAMSRAQELGIQTLQYRNIANELPKAVSTAIQSLVFLLLTITEIQVRKDKASPATPGHILFFWGENGELKGSVADIIWKQWINNQLDDSLGMHKTDVDLPDDWYQIVQRERTEVKRIVVRYQVTAHVVEFSASLNRHDLIDQSSGKLNRFQLKATFGLPEGVYPVTTYSIEEDLISALKGRATLQMTIGRLRLPRIRWISMYWPPSEKAMKKLIKHYIEAIQAGEQFDISEIGMEEIEGSDLRAVWDPIISNHPMIDNPTEDSLQN